MEKIRDYLISFAVERTRWVVALIVIAIGFSIAFFPLIEMDTDPENMLRKDEVERVFYGKTKREFKLSDTVVVGIVNEKHPDGVFNVESLKKIYGLTEFARSLCWKDEDNPGRSAGVIEIDMLAPSMVEHISQKGPGVISFEWLMPEPPENREEALRIRDRALSNPLLKGRVVSGDGRALCIYLPLTSKMLSYKIYTRLQEKVKEIGGDDEYHITGLPVAEGAVGVEMFTQIGIAPPLAMLLIMTLLFISFKRWGLVLLPLIIANISIICTMGLMIGLGFPVHILSSMLPIFLMSIAMVDSVHVISEFFDRYTKEKGRKKTIVEVMHTLFKPMLYTSLTTAAGFMSLVFAPIPPAQVFGGFLSIGVFLAWLITVIFTPAYVMMMPEKVFESLKKKKDSEQKTMLTKALGYIGRFTSKYGKAVIVTSLLIVSVSIWGITRIQVNDNYARRFTEEHPVRKGDIALNKHFDGIYTAFIIMETEEKSIEQQKVEINRLKQNITGKLSEGKSGFAGYADKIVSDLEQAFHSKGDLLKAIDSSVACIDRLSADCSEDEYYLLQNIREQLSLEKEKQKIFKNPEVLKYMSDFQKSIGNLDVVGKSVSIADVVRKINQELRGGDDKFFTIPSSIQGVAECFMQYQQSHRPHDLWHMVTGDYGKANIMVQFKTGDSRDTQKVMDYVEEYFGKNPPPAGIDYRWSGLHYINRVLEKKLVRGFLESFIGSFIIVFIMMAYVFRSVWWGLLCMLPLTVTLIIIYGITGITGKDYDLPVAVLSALSIGMAVDFAIHFLERARVAYREKGCWKEVREVMFNEPGRAISRNVIVIAVGFLPLLLAPLVPYKTTGLMLFAILTVSGLITLLVLPAILKVFENFWFRGFFRRKK